MKTYRQLIVLAVLTSLLVSPAVAQIPVTDATAIERAWAGHVEQITKWADQLNAMKQQYDQLQRQYDSITGSRGMGELMSNATRQFLPDDFTQSYQKLVSLGQGGASSEARQIYDAIKQMGCTNYQDLQARRSCEAQAYAEPENAAYIGDALSFAQERAQQLQQLLSQVNVASDMKAVADLGNRIAAEQAMLQNEQTLVNLALAQRQSQLVLVAQAKAEQNRKRLLENQRNPLAEVWK